MNTLEFNLPLFEGFYNSILDVAEYIEVGDDENNCEMTEAEFNSIDWAKTYENVGKWYLDEFIKENLDVLKQFGIELEFVKIDSPKYYNYSTDKLVCKATFNKAKLLREFYKLLGQQPEYWEDFIHRQFTSCDGFISSYSNDNEVWESELLDIIDVDNVVFETVLEFIISDTYEKEFLSSGLEDYYSFIEY